jgi:hypothetical protein
MTTTTTTSGGEEGTAITATAAITTAITAAAAAASSGSRPTNPRLTSDRLRRLEEIGFEWKVKNKMKRYYDRQWDQMFGRLLQFKQANGHCMVPKRYPPDMKLGTWVHTQRIQYRKCKAGTNGNGMSKLELSTAEAAAEAAFEASAEAAFEASAAAEAAGEPTTIIMAEEVTYRLTEERRQRLQDVGFVWSARESEKGGQDSAGRMTRNSYDDQWDNMFEQLRQFKEQHRDCLVPKRYQANPKLGTWVDTQRVQFKKLQKKLQTTHDQQGNSISTSISTSTSTSIMSTTPTSPPPTTPEDNNNDNNSSKPLVGRLTSDRIGRLHALGFVWSLRDDWQKHYDELQGAFLCVIVYVFGLVWFGLVRKLLAKVLTVLDYSYTFSGYKEEHGHCNVPARYARNRRLGIWVSAQRQQYKILHQAHADSSKPRRSAPLTQERIDLLNAIGFTWTIRSRDSLGESWNQRLQGLKDFKAEHGHCLVPSRYEPNPELGIWVGTQRTQYRLFMRSKETGVAVSTTTSMNEDRMRELHDLGFVWALRGTTTSAGAGGATQDEAVAAAEAAAAAVEAADQVGASLQEEPEHHEFAVAQGVQI